MVHISRLSPLVCFQNKKMKATKMVSSVLLVVLLAFHSSQAIFFRKCAVVGYQRVRLHTIYIHAQVFTKMNNIVIMPGYKMKHFLESYYKHQPFRFLRIILMTFIICFKYHSLIGSLSKMGDRLEVKSKIKAFVFGTLVLKNGIRSRRKVWNSRIKWRI